MRNTIIVHAAMHGYALSRDRREHFRAEHVIGWTRLWMRPIREVDAEGPSGLEPLFVSPRYIKLKKRERNGVQTFLPLRHNRPIGLRYHTFKSRCRLQVAFQDIQSRITALNSSPALAPPPLRPPRQTCLPSAPSSTTPSMSVNYETSYNGVYGTSLLISAIQRKRLLSCENASAS